MSDFISDEKCDEKINEKLSIAVTSVWQHKLSKDKFKTRLEKYNKSENCAYLMVPKVNSEIFGIINKPAKARDIKYQKLQNMNVKAGIYANYPNSRQLVNIKPGEAMTNKLLAQLKNNASNSLALLSCTNQSILQTRRDAIVQQLSKAYKQLRTTSTIQLKGIQIKVRT